MSIQHTHSPPRSAHQVNSPDLVRWMIEIDDFVRQVSDELTSIGLDLGQASEIPDAGESRELQVERTNAESRLSREDDGSSSLENDEVPLTGTARLQAIRERLTRMTSPVSGSEPARYSRDQG